jgi:hypothetical protein
MIADKIWIERNLGFNPTTTPAPDSTFSFAPAATSSDTENFQREIIDFDSESPAGREFLAFTTATGLSRFTDIPWPKKLAPSGDKIARKANGGRLPKGDVLVVTWTVDEGHALSRVLTAGKDSRNDWRPYTRNYAAISKKMRAGCPARQLKRLGTCWTGKIGSTTIVLFKSDSHMSQDGPELPNVDVWAQIINEVEPKLVITTGTAGGIGKQFEVGDVVVSPVVRFDCTAKFKKKPFHDAHYSNSAPNKKYFSTAKRLFKANAGQLPKDNTRPPKIVIAAPNSLRDCVVTTDFFGFDTSDDHYHLQGLGDVSEMGDAILGLVAEQMADKAPRWVAVRNVSDPQIKAQGSIRDQAALAATIYKGFGRWSSVCSAIVCWALIAAE